MTENPYEDLTDDEFNGQVLRPVIAEAKRRKFTIKADPFGVMPQRDPEHASKWKWNPEAKRPTPFRPHTTRSR